MSHYFEDSFYKQQFGFGNGYNTHQRLLKILEKMEGFS